MVVVMTVVFSSKTTSLARSTVGDYGRTMKIIALLGSYRAYWVYCSPWYEPDEEWGIAIFCGTAVVSG